MTVNKTSGKGLLSSTTVDFEVKAPFQILEDNRRRYIRLDIDEPISYRVIRSAEGVSWPDGDGPSGIGEILNISAGGILMYATEPVLPDCVLSLTIKIKGCEAIDNILAIAKRSEIDSGGYLIGLESVTREMLCDILSEAEMSMLPKNVASFTERLKSLLNQYIYSRKLNVENETEIR